MSWCPCHYHDELRMRAVIAGALIFVVVVHFIATKLSEWIRRP